MPNSNFFDLGFLRILENIRTPFLDKVMQFISYLGEETVFLLIALLVLWCVNKRRGYYLLCVGFLGTLINQFLKITFHIPRPWFKDPTFAPVESAFAGAGGYSFPSGHTQNAIGTFGSIARTAKNRLLRWGCIVLLLLISFSRMYLGVHTLMDVSVSLIIGVVLIFALYPIFRTMDEHPERMYFVIASFFLAAVAYFIYLRCYSAPDSLAYYYYLDSLKNCYSLLGALAGLLVVYPLERKFINYETKAVWWAQILKLGLGLALTLALKEGSKILFRSIFGISLYPTTFRYFLIVLFAGLCWPLTFKWFSKLGKK